MPIVIRQTLDALSDPFERASFRHALLQRIHRSIAARKLTWLAFGIGRREIRMVVDGDPELAARMFRCVKAGTSRAAHGAHLDLLWGDCDLDPVDDHELEERIAWCHRLEADGVPLSTPWTSHRDLLGFRQARFFDSAPLRARVDAHRVHRAAGGGRIPARRVPHPPQGSEPAELLRIAAAVHGLLPADRRTFRLFVHLGRAVGMANTELADALMLTARRIRQLASEQEPLLDTALAHLQDDRLRQLP